ncbi:hypothetical protein PHYBOEH_003810 [Phytophthora boehmeriae]|uniref:Uncharacterized protein n=1 Tax=Phytophthora boehmeriae TaxID=109152 RepID=A0A8T1XAU7_9STRA|nr:hypothetical protein PHYBOEH_003810 [Phytophthora boehmeriae]
MSVVLWYYSNLTGGDELSEDPVAFGAQPVQNEITPRVSVANDKMVLGQTPLKVEGGDELAVAKAFYVMSTGFDDSKTSAAKPSATVDTTDDDVVRPTEAVAASVVNEAPKVEAVAEQVASTPDEPVAAETEVKTASVAAENPEETEERAVVETEKVPTEGAMIGDATEASEIEAVDDEVTSETAVLEETHENNEPPTSEALVESDAIATEVSADATVADTVEEKLGDGTTESGTEIAKRTERMPSIPEDDTLAGESTAAVEEKAVTVIEEKNEENAARPLEENAVSDEQKKTEEVEAAEPSNAAEESVAAKVVVDESECETQSEISEAPAIDAAEPVSSTKIEDEPESEIGEYMVIDAEVAAKDAAVSKGEVGMLGFISEQLRKNSYVVSSVAVAVATIVGATLAARR